MFVPEIFRRNDFDELFEHPFDRAFGEMQRPQMPAMRTDVKETETGYELAIDLPGIKKENVQAQLHDGVLTVSATTQSEAEDKDKEGKYLHRERFSGSYSRSFYVGGCGDGGGHPGAVRRRRPDAEHSEEGKGSTGKEIYHHRGLIPAHLRHPRRCLAFSALLCYNDKNRCHIVQHPQHIRQGGIS